MSSSEKRHLIEAYREPGDARAVIAGSGAGLLAIAIIAIVGLAYFEAEPAAVAVTASRAASDR